MGGQGKARAAAKKPVADFRTRKAKVGRRIARGPAETDTSVHWSTLRVRADAPDAGLQSHDAFSLKDALHSTRNATADARKDALLAIRNLLSGASTNRWPEAHTDEDEIVDEASRVTLASSAAGPLLAACMERLADDDASVRGALAHALPRVLEALHSRDVEPFLPLVLAHAQAALTRVSVDVRLDALACVALLLEAHPSLTLRVCTSLAQDVIALLSPAAHPLGSASVIASLVPASYGMSGKSKPGGGSMSLLRRAMTSVSARVCVAFALRRMMLGGRDVEDVGDAETPEHSVRLPALGMLRVAADGEMQGSRVHFLRPANTRTTDMDVGRLCAAAFEYVAQAGQYDADIPAASRADSPVVNLSAPLASAGLLHLLVLWQECKPADMGHVEAHALQRMAMIAHTARLLWQACPSLHGVGAEEYAYAEQRAATVDVSSTVSIQRVLDDVPTDAVALTGCMWRQLLRRLFAISFPLPPFAELRRVDAALLRAAAAFHVHVAETLMALLPPRDMLLYLSTIPAPTEDALTLELESAGRKRARSDVNPFGVLQTVALIPSVGQMLATGTSSIPSSSAGSKRTREPAPVLAEAMPGFVKTAQKRWLSLRRALAADGAMVEAVATWLVTALEESADVASQRLSSHARESGDVPASLVALPFCVALHSVVYPTLQELAAHTGIVSATSDALLQAFSKCFKACHPLSPAKLTAVRFVSDALCGSAFRVPREMCCEWLQQLPRVLWQAAADYEPISLAIVATLLHLVRTVPPSSAEYAALQSSSKFLTPLLYGVRSCSTSEAGEGVYGAFCALSEPLQQGICAMLHHVTPLSPPLQRACTVVARRTDVALHIRRGLLRVVLQNSRDASREDVTSAVGTSAVAFTDLEQRLVTEDAATQRVDAGALACACRALEFLLGCVVEYDSGTVRLVASSAMAGHEGELSDAPSLYAWEAMSATSFDSMLSTFTDVGQECLSDAFAGTVLPQGCAQLAGSAVRQLCSLWGTLGSTRIAAMLVSCTSLFAAWVGADSAAVLDDDVKHLLLACLSWTSGATANGSALPALPGAVGQGRGVQAFVSMCMRSHRLAKRLLVALLGLTYAAARGEQVAAGAPELLTSLARSAAGCDVLRAHQDSVQAWLVAHDTEGLAITNSQALTAVAALRAIRVRD